MPRERRGLGTEINVKELKPIIKYLTSNEDKVKEVFGMFGTLILGGVYMSANAILDEITSVNRQTCSSDMKNTFKECSKCKGDNVLSVKGKNTVIKAQVVTRLCMDLSLGVGQMHIIAKKGYKETCLVLDDIMELIFSQGYSLLSCPILLLCGQ